MKRREQQHKQSTETLKMNERKLKTDPCIEWKGSKDRGGYGHVALPRLNGVQKAMNAHRWTWLNTYGPIAPGLDVMHICDNRACININHLVLGTRQANVNDMMLKGRCVRAKGSNSGRSKLTEAQIWEIRVCFESGWTDVRIGKHFGVTTPCIRSIRIGRTWSHLMPEPT